MSRVRAVFLGSGGFAVPILSALATAPGVELVGVVTAPARPVGRKGTLTPTPVAARAAELGVPVLTPDRLRAPDSVASLAGLGPDLLVLADYGQIVPQAVLDLPRHGALNLHPSLLPRHRGATPVPAAILAGDAETGATLMRMDAGLDTGPVIAQTRWTLDGTEDTPTLEAALAVQAAELLVATLPGWVEGTVPAVPQASDGATLTRPFRRADGLLDPTRPAVELERQVRALRPWPGTFVERPGVRLIVHEARVADADAVSPDARGPAPEPGGLVRLGSGIGLVTVAGLLDLLVVQEAGGRRMPAEEMVRGHPAWLEGSADGGPDGGSPAA